MEAFIRHLMQGLLSLGRVEVGGVTLSIDHVEMLPEPTFRSEMRFTCLSPITMSTRRHGERWAQYLSPDDPQFAAMIGANLKRKYGLIQALQGKTVEKPGVEGLSLDFDPTSLARHQGRISKLIDYKGTKIRGYQAPLPVTGPPELLRIGYACGFGDKNSQGFGMVEVARRDVSQTP